MNEHDLEYLREKLALLGEPELPPALSAAALFQRMEEGSLSLPEEDPLEETAAAGEAPAGESPSQGGKVIFWKKVLRRGIPLAACLALVLMVYQGREVGLAKNFSAANQPAPAPAAHAPEAAYDKGEESSGEQKSLLRSSKTEDAPAEGEEGQRPSALMAPSASSASSAPVSPEPGAGSDTTKQEKDASQEPENAPTPPLNESEEEEPLHPDSEEVGLNPDIGWGDPEEEAKADQRDQFIEDQAMAVATRYAPKEGLTPKWREIHQLWNDSFDQAEVNFLIRYYNQEGQEVASYSFDFILTEGDDPLKPHLEFVSFEEWNPS